LLGGRTPGRARPLLRVVCGSLRRFGHRAGPHDGWWQPTCVRRHVRGRRELRTSRGPHATTRPAPR